MHPSMFLEDGVNMKFAAEVKKYVKTPVAAVGSFSDPAMMEKALADGLVDVIEIGRGVIAAPDLPNKARMGKADEKPVPALPRMRACRYRSPALRDESPPRPRVRDPRGAALRKA